MTQESRIFDDFAKIAGNAAETFASARHEMEALIQAQIEKLMTHMQLVTRDEFNAIQEMAAQAIEENRALKARIERLEDKMVTPE